MNMKKSNIWASYIFVTKITPISIQNLICPKVIFIRFYRINIALHSTRHLYLREAFPQKEPLNKIRQIRSSLLFGKQKILENNIEAAALEMKTINISCRRQN